MEDKQVPPQHSVKKEPKFCRCRQCYEHFYADTMDAARQACEEHVAVQHPDWGEAVCFCPD